MYLSVCFFLLVDYLSIQKECCKSPMLLNADLLKKNLQNEIYFVNMNIEIHIIQRTNYIQFNDKLSYLNISFMFLMGFWTA